MLGGACDGTCDGRDSAGLDRCTPPWRLASGDLGQIYLMHDERDAAGVKAFADYLFDQGYEVLRPMFKGDEAEVREAHEENLRVCNGALIFYGATNEAWVRRKLREIQKSVGYGRTDPLPATSIVAMPPMTDEKQQFRTHDCTVINAPGELPMRRDWHPFSCPCRAGIKEDSVQSLPPDLGRLNRTRIISSLAVKKEIDDLLRRLRAGRFLAIIGTSGCGKSSLVRSGLIPALGGGAMSDASS